MNTTDFSNLPCAYFLGKGWPNPSGLETNCDGVLYVAERIVEAFHVHEVRVALEEIEFLTGKGYSAFGYLSYEAAGAFGLPVRDRPSDGFPLLWFGLCQHPPSVHSRSAGGGGSGGYPKIESTIPMGPETYRENVQSIHGSIARGDTYQVNFTIRAQCRTKECASGHGWALFSSLYRSQPVPYAALFQIPYGEIHCLSPELFLQKTGSWIQSRPMKGTGKRGRTGDEDRRCKHELQQSEKERAENIMIVDMTRNDLGRICQIGSIHTESICAIERYRSLFQMTSTIRGQLHENLSLAQILEATFPAASITGAPKHRTMDLIRQLEDIPRGIYCGSIGIIEPSGDFTFNVAIRTLVGTPGCYTIGVGGGIVWDSTPEGEYEEIKTKLAFTQLNAPAHSSADPSVPSSASPVDCPVDFGLIETLRLGDEGVYSELEAHLRRLSDSADYWDFRFDRSNIRKALLDYARTVADRPCVIRLALRPEGEVQLSNRPLSRPPHRVCVRIAQSSVHSSDRFLYHKTTQRAFYDDERQQGLQHGYFETIFRNEWGHMTEGCISNLFVRIGWSWFTPPLYDGLLPGIWRERILREKSAEERTIVVEDLAKADCILIGNSVMGSVAVDEIHDGGRIIQLIGGDGAQNERERPSNEWG